MLKRIDSFFINVVAPSFFQIAFDRQFPPGTDIHATISLSFVSNSLLALNRPDPHWDVRAIVQSWSIHLTGGGEGPRVFPTNTLQNAVSISNCARITFQLGAEKAAATAQINIYTF